MREHDANMHIALTQEVTHEKLPRGHHLYIFQDSNGLIKIGRSTAPHKRRRSIETASGKKLSVVAILPNRGCDETMVMEAAAQHRRTGEWFSPGAACRKAIHGALGMEFKWPIPLPQHLADWRARNARAEVEAAVQACVAKILANPSKRRRREIRLD